MTVPAPGGNEIPGGLIIVSAYGTARLNELGHRVLPTFFRVVACLSPNRLTKFGQITSGPNNTGLEFWQGHFYNMMQVARRVRSKSPFGGRRSRSKSPFVTHRRRSKSPFHRNLITRDTTDSTDVDDLVHESEINIFQQLCLDKHDDNAAIEILLEEPLALLRHPEIPDLCPTSSCSTTDASPKPLPSSSPQQTPGHLERKGTFLKRMFKSPSKSPPLESEPLENVPSRGSIASASSDGDDSCFIPKPPSRIPSVRDKGDFRVPYTMSKRIPSQRSETLSRMSSLSGTSSFTKPHALNRHESLGNDSIKDVRKALKEMEKQLGNASSHGKRISRQKVMRALFTVADSLDDLEERQRLKKELSGLMKMDREERRQQDLSSPSDSSSSSDDSNSETSSSSDDEEEESEEEYPTVEEPDEEYLSKDKKDDSFNLFSSVGKFFSVSPDEKKGVERALDDLLWTEFVITRHSYSTPTKEEPSFREDGFPRETPSKQPDPNPNPSSAKRLTVSTTVPNSEKSQEHRHIESSNRHDSGNVLRAVQMTNLATQTTDFERRSRQQEWELPSPIQLQERSPCRRGRSWWRRRPTQVLIKNDALNEFEHSPSTDVENHGYLPANIKLNDKKYRNVERGHSVPQARYQMKMVDTASRCGYEMTTASCDRKSSNRR